MSNWMLYVLAMHLRICSGAIWSIRRFGGHEVARKAEGYFTFAPKDGDRIRYGDDRAYLRKVECPECVEAREAGADAFVMRRGLKGRTAFRHNAGTRVAPKPARDR